MSSEAAEIALDVVGSSEIPVISTLADFGAAGLAFSRGDEVGGGLSLMSGIPLVGAVFNGAKWVKRLRGVFGTSQKTFQLVTRGGNTFSSTTYKGTIYKFGRSHAFDRPHKIPYSGGVTTNFANTTLTADRIESKIVDKLHGAHLPTLPQDLPLKGLVNVGRHRIEFTAGKLADGSISVGNYYLLK